MDLTTDLGWIWSQLDLGNEVPGWSLGEAAAGFDAIERAEDGARWVRLHPSGPWQREDVEPGDQDSR